MKKIIAMALLFATIVGCTSSGRLGTIDSTHVGWNMGQKVYEKYTFVEPTVSQAMHYAFKSGYAGELFGGLLLVAAAVFVGWSRYKDAKWLGNGFLHRFAFVPILALMAFGITLLVLRPTSIIADNEKKVSLETYNKHKDNMDVFWDSVYLNNKMQKANVKK